MSDSRLRREYAEELRQSYLQSGFKQGFEAGYAKAKEDFERPHGEWIPCSERLPEEKINPITHDFEEVLGTTIWGDVRHYKYGTPIGHDEAHFWYGFGTMDEEVIAWMPLPEPYKKEGDKE